VIDSLLFVFGFRASKMRHSKVSSLIHNSEAHPNLTSCSVEVHFQDVIDNPDGTTSIVPDSQLVVTRQSFKNNSSKYMIDDGISTFTEVTSLLRARGIDLDHKRFLILQGEVESIAQMKPKAENENDDGLLEYLEDIIGTSQYKKTIEESEAKVEVLNEDCQEKSNRLKIIQDELDSLEDQKNQIICFLETDNEITIKRSAFLQLSLYLCVKKVELSRKVLEQQETRLNEELARNASNKQEVQALKAENKMKLKELEDLKRRVAEKSKALSKRELEQVRVEEKKKHLDSKRKKLEKAIETATHSMNEASTWLGNYEEESAALSAQYQDLVRSLEKESSQLALIQEELKDKTQVFTDEIERTQRKLEPWREQIVGKESEIAVVKSEINLLKEQRNAAEASLSQSMETVKAIVSEGRAKEQELADLKKEYQHVTSQIKLGVDECDQAGTKLKMMKQKLVAGRQKVSSAREELNSVATQNKVLASLIKLNDSGRIQGFRGRLGALGTIDTKYDVAISTACPALDNMVVDTVEAGQHCIEYLRKHNLGRAKFILLDKLPKRDLSVIQTPENIPRLFDLVKPKNPKYAAAFYSVLSDTLVAEDADQARRIAYGKKRWRVVTVDGLLVESSGAMSGGGSTSKGKMKSNITQTLSDNELAQLEKKQESYEEAYQVAEKTFIQMETALKELQERKPVLELEISKVELDISNLSARLQDSQRQYKEHTRQLESSQSADSKALSAAEKRLAGLDKELQSLRERSQGLEQAIADLQEKIMEAGGVRLRMQKSKVDSVREQMELVNTRLSNGLLEKTKAQNETKKQRRAIEAAEKDISDVSMEAEGLGKELNERASLVVQLENEVATLTDDLDDRQELMNKLKEELESKQTEIDALRSTEIEIKNTIEQHQKVIKEEERTAASCRDQLKELKLHDISGLQVKSIKEEKVPVDGTEEGRRISDRLRRSSARRSSGQPSTVSLFEYSADELEALNKSALKAEIEALEQQNQEGRIDMQVLKDYRRRADEYEARRQKVNEAVASRDEVKMVLDDLRSRRLEEFMAGFNAISLKLKEMYQMITMGGNAELELVDSLDPFSEGILFSVMPPKKSWRNISNLSGGEKTLSSLALVFALHHYKPTPLYVMDEIDAALDFRNVSIVATYIKERTKNGQFIVISLRNNMFELAKQLVGIYKVNNMTRSIALKNDDYIRIGGDETNGSEETVIGR
jgi:structural maintenance of chromosome 4